MGSKHILMYMSSDAHSAHLVGCFRKKLVDRDPRKDEANLVDVLPRKSQPSRSALLWSIHVYSTMKKGQNSNGTQHKVSCILVGTYSAHSRCCARTYREEVFLT